MCSKSPVCVSYKLKFIAVRLGAISVRNNSGHFVAIVLKENGTVYYLDDQLMKEVKTPELLINTVFNPNRKVPLPVMNTPDAIEFSKIETFMPYFCIYEANFNE